MLTAKLIDLNGRPPSFIRMWVSKNGSTIHQEAVAMEKENEELKAKLRECGRLAMSIRQRSPFDLTGDIDQIIKITHTNNIEEVCIKFVEANKIDIANLIKKLREALR
jgi:hypothetical protein